MKDFDDYKTNDSDSKKDDLLEVKNKSGEETSIKTDINSSISTFNESIDQMNSLIVKEKPITKIYSSIHSKNRNGNTSMFFLDKNGSPLIVIGPDCKKKIL